MLKRLNKALSTIIPVESPTGWQDKNAQRWMLFLKIVWLMFMCTSFGLMVDQLYDSTKLYLSRAKVTDLTLNNVSSEETFWMCFKGKIPYYKHPDYISQLMVSIKRSPVVQPLVKGYNPIMFTSRLERMLKKKDDVTNVTRSPATSVKDYLIKLSQSPIYPYPENYWRKIRNMIIEAPSPTLEFNLYQCFSFNIPFPRTGGYTQYYIRKSSLSEIYSITILPGQTDYKSLGSKKVHRYEGLIAGRGNYPLKKEPSISQQFYVTVSRTKYTQQGENECKPDNNGEIYWTNCYIDCQNKKFSEKYSCTVIDYRNRSELLDNSSFCNLSHDLNASRAHSSSLYLRDNIPRLDKILSECKEECKPLDGCFNSDYQFNLQVAERNEKVGVIPNVLFSGNSKFTRIHLKFDRIQQSFKQYLAKNLDDYLADVGGIIGLYFGMSFVGVMHIIFYCVFTYLNQRGKRELSKATKKLADSQTKENIFAQFRQRSQIMEAQNPEAIEMFGDNRKDNTFDDAFVEKLMIHRSLIKQLVNDVDG